MFVLRRFLRERRDPTHPLGFGYFLLLEGFLVLERDELFLLELEPLLFLAEPAPELDDFDFVFAFDPERDGDLAASALAAATRVRSPVTATNGSKPSSLSAIN